MISNAKAKGRFAKQDFRYVANEDVYVCPAGEKLAYSFTTQDKGMACVGTGPPPVIVVQSRTVAPVSYTHLTLPTNREV